MQRLPLLLPLLLAAACTGAYTDYDPDTAAGAATPVSLTTRATTPDAATFAPGDRIAMRIGGEVKPYVCNADGTLTADGTPYYWTSGTGSTIDGALAWHPYSDALPATLTLTTDQSTDTGYASADFLSTGAVSLVRNADGSGSVSGNGSTDGSLTFRHRTTRVLLNIRPDGSSIRTLNPKDITGVTLCGHIHAEVDPNEGTLSLATGSNPPSAASPPVSPVTPHLCTTAAGGYTASYEVLFVPAAVSDDNLLTVTLADGKTFSTSLSTGSSTSSAPTRWEGGTTYTYNITLWSDRITFTAATTDVPWTPGASAIAPPDGYNLTVATADELQAFAQAVNRGGSINGVPARTATVLQTADIDLGGMDWEPIGKNRYYSFGGVYNGNGHTISNLKIQGERRYNGLFGRIEQLDNNAPVLTGIHLREVEIKVVSKEDACYSGALAGYIDQNAVISFCTARGKINTQSAGINETGGIAGYIRENTSVSHCRADVEVTAVSSTLNDYCYAGGIVGDNFGTILACEALGKPVSAKGNNAYAGGIIGRNVAVGSIYFCAAGTGTITATGGTGYAYSGGLVGWNNGNLGGSYSRGTATATSTGGMSMAGAIVGSASGSRLMERYCIGTSSNDKGSSDLDADSGNIVYKADATDQEIYNVVGHYQDGSGTTDVVISTTTYNASSFPAYGIEVTSQKFNASVWNCINDKLRLNDLPQW